MVGDEGAGVKQRHAGGVGEDGTHDQSGNSQRASGLMALQARVAAFETGMGGGFLIQGVEDDAQFGIEGGELQDVARADESDRYVVVEIERPRECAARCAAPGSWSWRRLRPATTRVRRGPAGPTRR